MDSDAILKRRVNLAACFAVSALVILTGLLFIFYTHGALRLVMAVVGVWTVLAGVRSFFISWQFALPPLARSSRIRGVLMILAGFAMAAYPFAAYQGIWTFLMLISSLVLISSGITALSSAIVCQPEGWSLGLAFEGALLLLTGVITLANPEAIAHRLGNAVLKVLGLLLVVFGVCFFISNYNKRYDLKEI